MQSIELKLEKQDFRTKEAFKTLRTNIEFSGENIRVICVTSCTPNEGKSSVSYELAKSFAQNGKKTILIDADLRKSVMRGRHKKGKVRFGLTNYLVGKVDLDTAICETDIPNFHLLFAGPVPPNPSELLGNTRFQKMVEACRMKYDMVIIDTPPLGSVIDTAVVSKFCDGAVIILACGEISYRFAKRVKDQLAMTGCKILGCVLNKVEMSGKGYYGKYYGLPQTACPHVPIFYGWTEPARSCPIPSRRTGALWHRSARCAPQRTGAPGISVKSARRTSHRTRPASASFPAGGPPASPPCG